MAELENVVRTMTVSLRFPEMHDAMGHALRQIVDPAPPGSSVPGAEWGIESVTDLVEFFTGVLHESLHRADAVGEVFVDLDEMEAVSQFADTLDQFYASSPAMSDDALARDPGWLDVVRAATKTLWHVKELR